VQFQAQHRSHLADHPVLKHRHVADPRVDGIGALLPQGLRVHQG
jgi:hypothetical protein